MLESSWEQVSAGSSPTITLCAICLNCCIILNLQQQGCTQDLWSVGVKTAVLRLFQRVHFTTNLPCVSQNALSVACVDVTALDCVVPSLRSCHLSLLMQCCL